MSVSRRRWEEAQDRYSGHTQDADSFAESAIDELNERNGDAEAAAVWALVAIGRRIEALAELFLDFMEPAKGRREEEDDE